MEYVAHFRKDKNIVIQSLYAHIQNVGNMCKLFGSKINMKNFCFLCGLVHDIGKYGIAFQEYIKNAILHTVMGDYEIWIKSVKKIDHGVYGAKLIYEMFESYQNIAMRDIGATVVCYHHGGLPDTVKEISNIPLLDRINGCDIDTYNMVIERFKKDVNIDNLDKIIESAKEEVCQVIKKLQGEKIESAFYLNLIIKSVYSILIDSDRMDSYYFEANIEYSCEDNYRKDVNASLWEEYLTLLEKKLQEFKNKPVELPLERKVKETRQRISDECFNFASNETGIYKLTVPTGGGKTLSSLRFALKHAIENKKEKIIYIIPYTTIIEQNANEVRNILNCNDNLLEYHSNVINDTKNEVQDEVASKLTAGFECPIIFTTMVQFLNCFYDKSTQNTRKIHSFFNSVIIFDEVQTVPTKCISLFNLCVNYLKLFGDTTAVLCTATQPNLDEMKHNIMLSENSQIVSDYKRYYQELKRMVLVNCCTNQGYTYEQACDFVLDKKSTLNSALVVLNTISSANKMYVEIEKNKPTNVKVYYLSTHLCPAHRKKIIQEIKASLKNKEQIICISTQLIEAGVDISFDTVIRSKCGLDSAAQATGRGNRHGENPLGYAYIINIVDEAVDRIKEIFIGQMALSRILDDKKNNGLDLLSTQAIEKYYEIYNNDDEIKSLLDYNVKNSETIYSMLSTIRKRNASYRQVKAQGFPLCFNTLFKTAGEQFKVIDDDTKTIIVPYDKGKEIIAKLNSSLAVKDKQLIIKQAQQYSVNVWTYLYKKLQECNAIQTTDIDGVYYVKDGFYHHITGITTNKELPDLML